MSRNTWDRDRFLYERERERDGRHADERIRFEDDHFYRSPSSRHRDLSVDDRYERRASRPHDDDDEIVIRDSRRVYYDDEPRYHSRHRSPPMELERDRRVLIERERLRSPSPNRPAFLRRQSSLDTFDRRPKGYHIEEERYGPPARISRDDFRPRPYEPIPLPRSRGLPPPRRYADHEYYDEIRVSDPDHYGDDEYRAYPERVREREVIRTRRRDLSPAAKSTKSTKSSRTGRSHSHSHRAGTLRSSSRSSATTSSSSSSGGGTTVTVKSEYPKKGKTRIPARLVSKRALIDLGYPFVEEGQTVVVLKALGQENIDDLLKLSEDYKKSEVEVLDACSEAGNVVEERRETIVETLAPPPPPPMTALPPPPATVVQGPPSAVVNPPPPMFMNPGPPPPPPPPPMFMNPGPPAAEVVEQTTVIRDVSPARSYTTSYTGSTHTSATPHVLDYRRHDVCEDVPVGSLALVRSSSRHSRHSRSRSRSRSHRELRSEIKELARRHHGDREILKAERLSTGELVLYEEEVERIEEPRRGVRIEKDKKGRMSISVPKYR